MSKTRQGTVKERECRLIYEAAGYDVTRAAASKGGADLIATNEHRIVFIQVKKTSRVSAVRASAVRELLAIRAPWIDEVDRLAWIYVKQAKPGKIPEGWCVICVHEDGSSHGYSELATLTDSKRVSQGVAR